MKKLVFIPTILNAIMILGVAEAYANEGPLWIYMLISPLIIIQNIPFLLPILIILAAFFLIWRFLNTGDKGLLFGSVILFAIAIFIGIYSYQAFRMEVEHQERIKANRARVKAMYEGKQVPPLDPKAINEEMQKKIKPSGNPEVDRLNRQAVEELTYFRAAIDAQMNNHSTASPQRGYNEKGNANDECKQWREGKNAAELVVAARKAKPEYSSLHPGELHSKGLEHYGRHEDGAAIWAWECEIKKNPQAIEALNDIGIAYMKLNNPELSLEYAHKALSINSGFAHAHYTAGRALLIMGRYSEARTEVEAAVTGGWELWRSYEILGLALRGLSEDKKGDEALRKALSAQPGNQEIKGYVDGSKFEPTWPACQKALTVTAPIEKTKTPVPEPKRAEKVAEPEVTAWEETKGSFPLELTGKDAGELEAVAKIKFEHNDLQAAAALWLKAAEFVEDPQKKARLWSQAARALGKHVSDTTPTAESKEPRITTPRRLSEKAFDMAQNDEDVIYTAAILQYESLRFNKAAAILKSADNRIKMNLPSLHLMEVVYSLANDWQAQRNAALRIGYDPFKTVAGWRPYDWDMWRATCVPSESSRSMKSDGSVKMTWSGALGGVFLLMMLFASGFTGWQVSSRGNRALSHIIIAIFFFTCSVIMFAVIEKFANILLRTLFFPWFFFVMTLPVWIIATYIAGCIMQGTCKGRRKNAN